MKAVILAGGFGTRLSEETSSRPKPMIEIGNKPILWHIMKMYAHNGITDFIICCGYKGYVIKEYFANYHLHMSDVTFELRNNRISIHNQRVEPWTITLVDTGEVSMTGGRLLRVSEYLRNEEAFCMTYGDGVANLNIKDSIDFHFQHGKAATVTAVLPPGRFGALKLRGSEVMDFEEKPRGDDALINGGFFVLSPKVFSYIENDETVWEQAPLSGLAKDGQLMAYQHLDFWHPMDTLRDKNMLEELWLSRHAPWKVWKD